MSTPLSMYSMYTGTLVQVLGQSFCTVCVAGPHPTGVPITMY